MRAALVTVAVIACVVVAGVVAASLAVAWSGFALLVFMLQVMGGGS